MWLVATAVSASAPGVQVAARKAVGATTISEASRPAALRVTSGPWADTIGIAPASRHRI